MRHRVAGSKLGRTSEHRIALLRNMSTSLFQHERIRTTLSKARELRRFAEKLVTMSKKETLHARRHVGRHIHDKTILAKLFDTLSPRYANRPGGYTRIMKLGPRRGDNAEMAIIEMVDSRFETDAAPAAQKTTKKKATKKKAAAKTDAAGKGSRSAKHPGTKESTKAAGPIKTSSKARRGD